MNTRFVSVDRDQPLLLPPDLRDWIPQDDLVHFVIQAVEGMDLPSLKVSVKASGSAQYPPHMMLSLLIYCYASGIFSSRRHDRAFKIGRATHRIEARAKAKAHKEQTEDGAFQPSLFDAQNLAKITSDSYPGERLAVCYNPLLAEDRKRTRDELLAATEARLAKIAASSLCASSLQNPWRKSP